MVKTSDVHTGGPFQTPSRTIAPHNKTLSSQDLSFIHWLVHLAYKSVAYPKTRRDCSVVNIQRDLGLFFPVLKGKFSSGTEFQSLYMGFHTIFTGYDLKQASHHKTQVQELFCSTLCYGKLEGLLQPSEEFQQQGASAARFISFLVGITQTDVTKLFRPQSTIGLSWVHVPTASRKEPI